MRVLVTITPGLKELIDDLQQVPQRYRSERIKALAYAGLKASEESEVQAEQRVEPVTSAEDSDAATAPAQAPALGMAGSNDEELFDDSD